MSRLLSDLLSRFRDVWRGSPPPEDPREYFRNPKVWSKVESSNVGAVAYYFDIRRKGQGNRLAVWFKTSGMVYLYDAPHSMYVNMLAASSKGRYVHEYLKGLGYTDKWPASQVM